LIHRYLIALTFSGKLNRIEFLIAIIAIGVLSYVAQRGVSAIGFEETKSTIELLRNIMIAHTLVALICLPFFVCRLRDMRWPTILAALVLVPLVPQSVFLYHLLTGGEHASYQLAVYLNAVNYSELFALAFFVLLLLWPGRNPTTQTQS